MAGVDLGPWNLLANGPDAPPATEATEASLASLTSPRDEAPLLRSPRGRDSLLADDGGAYGEEDDDADDFFRGHFLLTAMVLLAGAMAACLAVAFLVGHFFHIDPDAPVLGHTASVGAAPAGGPAAAFCLAQSSEEPAQRTATPSRLPPGASSVYAVLRTTSPWQIISAWGDQAQLALDAAGRVEYQEMDRASGRPVVLRAADGHGHRLTDGHWHAVAIVRSAAGEGELFVDGFPVGQGRLPVATPDAGLDDVDFDGSLASLRIFDRALGVEQLGRLQDVSCVFPTTSTTVTVTASAVGAATQPATTTTATSTTTTTTVPRVAIFAATVTATTTSTTISTTRTTTTMTTRTQTTTSTTRTVTSTTTITSTTRTSTSTHTTTLPALPEPFFSSPGLRGPGGELHFEGAELPPSDRDLSLVFSFVARSSGARQELVSWGTADGSAGCVSLYLDPGGSVSYGEMFVGDAVWGTLSSGDSLVDGKRHFVVLSRSALGLVYLYVDGKLAGQGIFEAPRPSEGLPDEAVAAKSCRAAGPNELAFEGTALGFQLFDHILSARQIAELAMVARRLRGTAERP